MHSKEYLIWAGRLKELEKEIDSICLGWEFSKARVIELSELLKKAIDLPPETGEYFTEAVKCLEFNFYRAAIIFSWAGFVAVFSEVLVANYYDKMKLYYKAWDFSDAKELREIVSEYQIIESAFKVRMINKNKKKVLHGRLAERNECAHPTGLQPSRNESIGYVDGIIRQTHEIVSQS